MALLPLPGDDGHLRWNVRSATAAWLASQPSPHTRAAYFKDLSRLLSWCESAGLDPRRAGRADIDAFVAGAGGTSNRGARLAASSLTRRLAALSSWYQYLGSVDLVDKNPVAAVKRPKVDWNTSTTVGLGKKGLKKFLKAARRQSGPQALRDLVMVELMAVCALRVAEVIALDCSSFRVNGGYRTVVVRGKGGKVREIVMPAGLVRDLDTYSQWRVDQGHTLVGAAFVTSSGRRVTQPWLFRAVRRIAVAAGLDEAELLSNHGLRHTAATRALDEGAELRDVQDMLGHASPVTTRRYDLARGNLKRSPTHRTGKLLD